MGIVEQYLSQLNTKKQRFRRSVTVLSVLSLLVILTVSWNLRQTGITIANSACCGYQEHQHTEECSAEKVLVCDHASFEPMAVLADEITETTSEATTEDAAEVPQEETLETAMEAVIDTAAEVLSESVPDKQLPETAARAMEETDPEHVHADACYEITWLCGLEEHIHMLACYSDLSADLEDWDIWSSSIPELTGRISEDIVLVARSQLGCGESDLNFELAGDGETQNGITRYGQWYGNPYGPWSNMFTSFCLRYAGLTNVPVNSGAEKMMMEWEAMNLYRHAGSYEPVAGDIVFLDKNQNGTPEATAVVVRYFDFVLTVIEGDVNNTVAQQEYRIDDPVVTGYGITNSANRLMMFASGERASSITIGTPRNNYPNAAGTYILYATIAGASYAIDHNGDAVPVTISGSNIIADVADPTTLYWFFTGSRNSFAIQNVASPNKYLYPNANGLLSSTSQNLTLSSSGSGAKFRSGNYYLQLTENGFGRVQNQNSGSVIYFGNVPAQVSLWLDGTNGNLMSYRGSDNTRYAVYSGIEMQLPSTWKSPTKYEYKLAGWVNIKTGDYYLPGDRIAVTENTVLYADWVANTYDIGQYNSNVADTISTNDFITTHIFDYSSLINLHSTQVSINVSDSSHSETWSHVASGNVTYRNRQTLNFSFNDHDDAGTISNLNNRNDPNTWTGGVAVYSGIYTDRLGEVMFGTDNLYDPETGEGIVGKHYLGQGDHLFQIDTDPTSEFYGYYYYDAKLNAASYNQSDQRFYVYDYLTRASDSGQSDPQEYSDFLPLNSPYANTNGRTVKTYAYAGQNGEYSGVTHYSYDSRYDANGSAVNQVMANMWFGMRTDIRFGLPDAPGQRLEDGGYGNKDIYGNDMHFYFTGDDDVWILVDGKVALDLGGIHLAAEGEINFSTGEVRVNGSKVGTLSGIQPGEHTLSILYLERGASMGNCGIYFNLAPRFSLTLQKEDVLTQEVLNGAQFAFYHDQACTKPCDLWPSQKAYKNGEDPTNVFTIQNGQVYIWGLSPSRTYYIKEVAPPDKSGYDPAKGVIRLTLDKNGLNSYSATILPGPEGTITHGFTVHGFRIDEENQAAYIVITNAQNWVTETTSIYVEKKWNDSKDHTYESVTVYLQVTDPDGTVRRIREIALSEENGWKYEWINLPKYLQDSATKEESDVPVQYSVAEAYVPGYQQNIIVLQSGVPIGDSWAESQVFVNGKDYILKTNSGYLSTVSKNGTTLMFVDEETAKSSELAIWKATVSNNVVRLENQAGQSLNFYNSNNTRYFNATTGTANTQNLPQERYNNGVILSHSVTTSSGWWGQTTTTKYYLSTLSNGNAGATTSQSSALVFYPMQKMDPEIVEFDGYGYRVTNTPLSSETSLKVTKRWSHPTNDASAYEKLQVTVKLLSNGVDTGRTETISLKSNWTAVFNGLPYVDANGEPVVYSIVETWNNNDWIPVYGEIQKVNGSTPTYEMTLTNRYRWIDAFELPSTGGIGYPILILCGLPLVVAPLVYGLSLRRRHRKEARE